MSDENSSSAFWGFVYIALIFFIGFNIGMCSGKKSVHDKAIKNGHMEYNKITGEREWVENEISTND